MDYIKRRIVEAFKEQYGFAPSMKSIIPMESFGYSNHITWLAFHINGIGYEYRLNDKVMRNDCYNFGDDIYSKAKEA